MDNRKFNGDFPPFVIAEMSGNHNQSLDRALAIVDAAASAGAHALKIQTYTAETMTIDVNKDEFSIHDSENLWAGQALFDLYKKAHTPWEWHKPIFDRAAEHGMIAFSTPFDESAVDFLEGLNVPMYKIASFENTDLPLIKYAASTGKPLIISTGMATGDELEESVTVARDAGCTDLVLLKCTSTYPASPLNTNIATIPDLRQRFGCHVGISDHTMGIGVALGAVALGATVIEKHFTLRRADGGVDSSFSMEPDELRQLAVESERVWQSIGSVSYGPTAAEKNSLVFRRSIYIVEDVEKGEVISEKNVRRIRPGLGLPPKHFNDVLGRRFTKDLGRGTPLTWDLIE
ncbi:MAG: pseudaminic acid synthase [Ilumatobacteraceae bacterium]